MKYKIRKFDWSQVRLFLSIVLRKHYDRRIGVFHAMEIAGIVEEVQ